MVAVQKTRKAILLLKLSPKWKEEADLVFNNEVEFINLKRFTPFQSNISMVASSLAHPNLILNCMPISTGTRRQRTVQTFNATGEMFDQRTHF